MRRRKKLIPLVVLTIISLAGLIIFAAKFSPSSSFNINPLPFTLNPLYLFFPLIFLVTSSLFSLLLNNIRRGFLVGLGVTTFLVLRFFQLTHPFYIALLLLTLVALEFTFRKS